MSDLRERLERESERVTLAAGAADRMFERGRRRERTRRVTALALGAALFVLVLVIVRASAPADRTPRPAAPTPTAPGDVAGTYRVFLPNRDTDVERLGMGGTYTMYLGNDGSMELGSPRGFDLSGAPITFDVERGRFTTDAFVGAGCEAPGTYRVALDAGSLRLVPVEDPCEVRTTLLAADGWTATGADPAADPLEGDWVASFSCEQMVRAVERAPISPESRAFWAQGMGAELGSDEPADPCSGVTEMLSFTFRFADGRLLIFDADLREGFDGAYEMRGSSFKIRDATTRNIDGAYRMTFSIDGDVMRVDLVGRGGRDPFFIGTWESAPLIRTSG